MTDSQEKPPIPETINGATSNGRSTSSRGSSSGHSGHGGGRHRRSNSADLSQTVQHQQHIMMMMHGGSSGSLGGSSSNYGYPGTYGGPMPPPPPPQGYQYYAYGAPPPQRPYSPVTTPNSQSQMHHGPQTSTHPPAHRARSWSGGPSMFDQQQQAQWMAAMQMQQNVPFMPDSGFGFPSYGAAQSGTPQSTRHRRSNSSSSVGSGGGGGKRNSNRSQFSPRSEFMKLANVQGSPRGSPRSQYAYNAPGGVSPYAPHLQVPMTVPPPPPPQAYESVYDNFERGSNDRTSPYVATDKNFYGGVGSGSLSSFMTPEQAYYGSNNLVTSSLGSTGGEAVYLAQQARNIGSHSGGPTSSRKRHMRQKSVQLFMKDIKGIQQPPACRDVFFLLLFVFHLFGMVLLSNMYSYVALEKQDDQTTTVTVNYQNLLIIAGFCGAFAIVVSTTLLGVMSYFARNFVQVALIMAIALSFVWGTLGIGLSPQNLVPVTGIVALALSVAYAIIVWDRVPFSTANLLTALSAVRAFPTTVIMTVVSQLLGLGWSIYFAVVCCGIYDAIEEGRINVSHQVAVLIYVLLGISYYWTIQVFLVSCFLKCRPC